MFRKTAVAALMTMLLLPAMAQQITVNFEDLNLSSDTFWNGADMTGGFYTNYNATFFSNNYVDWGGGVTSWDGFAYSNMFNENQQSFDNMYSCYAGNNSNGIHGLAYLYSDWVNFIVVPGFIRFSTALIPLSIQVTNSTYAALTMLNGDFVAKKFGGTSGNEPDWFKLSIFGYNDGISTDTIDFFLADYRFVNNNDDYIIKEWTSIDLTSLNPVDSLGFLLSSSDTGAYGMNTPAVFCFDNLDLITPSGIRNLNFSNQLPYPNPCFDKIIIPDYMGEYELYSLSGVLLMSGYTSGILNIEKLNTGTYILKTGNIRTIVNKI